MKTIQYIALSLLTVSLLGGPGLAMAADQKAAAPKPYPLKTCLVTDEKLDSKPYVYVYEGREIKFCCQDCLKDFKKDPAKYIKKLDAAEKKTAQAGTNQPSCAMPGMDSSAHQH
jgi:YHS domain-containing protein